MTAPIEPTVTDSKPADTGAGGAVDNGPKADAAKEWKLEELPAEAQAYVRKLTADAEAKARTTSKTNAANEARALLVKELGPLLGLTTENTDPKVLADQLVKAQADRVAAIRERDLVRIAGRASVGGDADALLDSTAFTKKLHALDADSATYAADLEKLIIDEVAANPRFKASGAQAPAAQGAAGDFSGSGGSSSAGAPGVEDLDVAAMRKMLYPTK